MAKSRAQRKAEQRKREEQLRRRAREAQAKARGATGATVDESADVAGQPADVAAEPEAEHVERPAMLGDVGPFDPIAESEMVSADPVKRSRREERREAKERERRAQESAKRREGAERGPAKERGPVTGFFFSVSRELQRVQWPDRETLIQASAVTLLFVAIAAAYLGALDAAFNQVVKFIL